MKKYTKAEVAEFVRLARELLLKRGFVHEGGEEYRYDGAHNIVYAVVDQSVLYSLSVFMRFERPVMVSGETRPRTKLNYHSLPHDTIEESIKGFSLLLTTAMMVANDETFLFTNKMLRHGN